MHDRGRRRWLVAACVIAIAAAMRPRGTRGASVSRPSFVRPGDRCAVVRVLVVRVVRVGRP